MEGRESFCATSECGLAKKASSSSNDDDDDSVQTQGAWGNREWEKNESRNEFEMKLNTQRGASDCPQLGDGKPRSIATRSHPPGKGKKAGSERGLRQDNKTGQGGRVGGKARERGEG